jgi:hypothetical protein
VTGFLVRKAQQHLGEHVQHEQSVIVLDVDFALVAEPELVGLVRQELVVATMEKKIQWMGFELHRDSTDDADGDELYMYISEAQ